MSVTTPPLPADSPITRLTVGTVAGAETAGSDSSGGRAPRRGAGLVPALVILWARHEADRPGEVFLVEDGAGPGRIIGRRAGPDPRRLPPLRQRPGGGVFTLELQEPGMSREQLRVRRIGEDRILLANVGKRACRVRGQEVPQGVDVEIIPGDVVEVDRQLLLLCELRPPVLPAIPGYPRTDHPFGVADDAGLVGESPVLWALRGSVAAVAARAGEHVLIQGPSGTGKEAVARAIHRWSARGKRPLISRSAASIPEGLLDAELFGNVEHFPNPGMRAHGGLVGEADGSTLFLDEIGEITHELQARLLRVMDAGEYTPLGSARPREADLRVVAATNRDPEALKHDFLARFPLRVRTLGLGAVRADIPLIARAILAEIGRGPGLERFQQRADAAGVPRMSVGLTAALMDHGFTTHVRELRQLLHRCLMESPGPWVEPCEALRSTVDGPAPRRRPTQAGARPEPVAPRPPEEAAVFTPQELERLHLQRRYAFDARRCGDAEDYPTNRQNAALTLNVLISKALRACGWRGPEAAALLRGSLPGGEAARLGDPAWRRLQRRMRSFVERQRQEAAEAGALGAGAEIPADLRRYGAQAADVLALRRALAEGRVDVG